MENNKMEYIRENNRNKVEIIEVNSSEPVEIKGKKILPQYLDFGRDDIKTYMIIEEYSKESLKDKKASRLHNLSRSNKKDDETLMEELTTIDYVYGNLDDVLANKSKKKRYMKRVFTRDGINKLIKDKRCGAVPSEIEVIDNGKSFSYKEDEEDKEKVYLIMKKVLENAHQDLILPKEEKKEETALIFKLRDWYNRKVVEFDNKGKEPEKEKDGKYNVFNVEKGDLVVFYRSGDVICKIKVPKSKDDDKEKKSNDKEDTEIREVVISRYNLCLGNKSPKDKSKDDEEKEEIKTEIYSFLISGLDERKLEEDKEYKDSFATKICKTLIPNMIPGKNEPQKTYSITWDWKWLYLGEFKADDEYGLKIDDVTKDLQVALQRVGEDKTPEYVKRAQDYNESDKEEEEEQFWKD